MSAHPPERLNRFLARRGVASRRGADALIAEGRVTVNGEVSVLGTVVHPSTDRVCVDGRRIPARTVAVTIVLNKPVGVVTTRSDPYQRRTVMDLIEPVPGLVPVGRLDADSRGLLVLTTDGDLAHAVSHPRHGVTKRYLATLDRAVGEDQLARLAKAPRTRDGAPLGLFATLAHRPRLMTRLNALGGALMFDSSIAARERELVILRTAFRFEIEAYNRMVGTEDRQEGIRAFNEKRKPQFRGR